VGRFPLVFKDELKKETSRVTSYQNPRGTERLKDKNVEMVEPDITVHICGPVYSEGRGRRIVVRGQLG
jgi:hypothetical protein